MVQQKAQPQQPANSRNGTSIHSQHVSQFLQQEDLPGPSNIPNVLTSALQYFEELNQTAVQATELKKYEALKTTKEELQKAYEDLKKQMEQMQQKLKKEQNYCKEILKQNEQLKQKYFASISSQQLLQQQLQGLKKQL